MLLVEQMKLWMIVADYMKQCNEVSWKKKFFRMKLFCFAINFILLMIMSAWNFFSGGKIPFESL